LRRLYLVFTGLWMLGVVLLGGPRVLEILRDGRALRVAMACKVVQDEDFYGLPEREQLKVYAAICPNVAAVYTSLSFGAKERLSSGRYRGRSESDVITETRHAGIRASTRLAGIAFAIPALGWVILLLARWIARGFINEREDPRGGLTAR